MATITAARQRKLQRTFHLLAGATLLAYIYIPAADERHDLVRFVVVPVLALTGIAMWQTPRLRRAIRRLAKTRARGGLRSREEKAGSDRMRSNASLVIRTFLPQPTTGEVVDVDGE